jgi:hypothetical protein
LRFDSAEIIACASGRSPCRTKNRYFASPMLKATIDASGSRLALKLANGSAPQNDGLPSRSSVPP